MKEHVTNPCMIVIGEVVKLREKINWFEQWGKPDSLLMNDAL